MLQLLLATLIYGFALTYTLALVVGVPVFVTWRLLGASRGGRRTVLSFTALVAVGYLAGGVLGWLLRPAQWTMPLAQTLEAAMNASKYGHVIESQAERVLMYPWYMAVLCSAVLAVASGIVFRFRSRAAA
jgi:hypothetical protein